MLSHQLFRFEKSSALFCLNVCLMLQSSVTTSIVSTVSPAVQVVVMPNGTRTLTAPKRVQHSGFVNPFRQMLVPESRQSCWNIAANMVEGGKTCHPNASNIVPPPLTSLSSLQGDNNSKDLSKPVQVQVGPKPVQLSGPKPVQLSGPKPVQVQVGRKFASPSILYVLR